jgi:aspartyl-tRNA synthetase
MTHYRTHTCGQLRKPEAGQRVRLAGFLHRRRDHGGVLFLDLRDHYCIAQLVIFPDAPFYTEASSIPRESVLQVEGEVRARDIEAINPAMPTGEIEVHIQQFVVLSEAGPLPFPIAEEQHPTPENLRLQYRFLDLRRQSLHRRIALRAQIVASIRQRLSAQDFLEIQTPILTSSSPEGARDFLVPSRLHPGQFYALPQAPQQFKQLLMVAGFDRYFQIAPCFRDEDARADRSPGEFYQLDLEMAFVTQEDIFAVIEELFTGLFGEFSDWQTTAIPFPRITYKEAMRRYGSDKPDLRFGLEIEDVSSVFAAAEFRLFRQTIEDGGVVRALCVEDSAHRPRSFFSALEQFIKDKGGKGLAYLSFSAAGVQGPIAAALDDATIGRLRALTNAPEGSSLLFVADTEDKAANFMGQLRLHLADTLNLREKNSYRFCWIVDFPMYEWDSERQTVAFSHNPFSMPQGGIEALDTQRPLDILAYQYDIVCNGTELSSGAIRNHRPDILYKAFEIAGYKREVVDDKFGGMVRAFQCGAPPHGGIAPGLDRIAMLLADERNIREVIAFPVNQSGQDLLMGAPGAVSKEQLDELHIAIKT